MFYVGVIAVVLASLFSNLLEEVGKVLAVFPEMGSSNPESEIIIVSAADGHR